MKYHNKFDNCILKSYILVDNNNPNLRRLMNDLINRHPISKEGERYYISKLNSEDEDERLEAKHKLIEHNMRFALTVAHHYRIKNTNILDIIQEAFYGLCKAAEGYKSESTVTFITYAVFWIRKYILASLSNSTIKIPDMTVIKYSQYLREVAKFIAENEREPNGQEAYHIAKHLDISYEVIKAATTHAESYDDLEMMERMYYRDSYEDTYDIRPAIEILTDDEKYVINHKFGLEEEYYGKEYSVKDIAKKLNIPISRCTKIYKTAISKLRRSRYLQSEYFGRYLTKEEIEALEK